MYQSFTQKYVVKKVGKNQSFLMFLDVFSTPYDFTRSPNFDKNA
jgi:hypothetical protein